MATPQRIQPPSPEVKFTDQHGKLTLEGYQLLYALYLRVGGMTKDFTANTLTIDSGVSPTGAGFKHTRVTTGAIGPAASALVTYIWPTAFADANYTVSASVVDVTAAPASLRVVHIENITAAQVVVRVENTSAGALTGTLHLIAVHD